MSSVPPANSPKPDEQRSSSNAWPPGTPRPSVTAVKTATPATAGDTSRVAGPAAKTLPAAGGAAELPEVFGKYRIVRKLGQGGMAVVYLAQDTVLHRQVAIKLPLDDVQRDPELVKRFLREAQSAAGLTHPNICHVYDNGEIGGRHFIAMEFVDGKSLADASRGIEVKARQAADLVRRIALTIAAAHEKGIIHRDLKPSNILLTKVSNRLEPKITDFGLAKRLDIQGSDLSKMGSFMGTPAYVSKEQALGEPPTPAMDIYSLGVVLYELLAGRLPFEGPDTVNVLAQVLMNQPAPPSTHRPGLCPTLEAICLKAVAKDPRERYASMADFAAALSGWLQGNAKSEKTDTGLLALRPKPASARFRGRRQPLVATLLGAAAFVALGIVLYIATNHGTIKLELSDPTAQVEVKVDGDRLDITGLAQPLSLRAGPHGLEVTGKDFETVTQSFTVKRGKNPVVTIALIRKSPPPPPPVPSSEKYDPTINFKYFSKWNVTRGSVDISGNGFNDVLPGNDLYLDLDGTTGAAVRLESKAAFDLKPGADYELRFDLAGSQGDDGNNTVHVSLGDAFKEDFTLPGNAPFRTITRTIKVNQLISAKLVFDHDGGDNAGLHLDNVKLTDTTNRAKLLHDDFLHIGDAVDSPPRPLPPTAAQAVGVLPPPPQEQLEEEIFQSLVIVKVAGDDQTAIGVVTDLGVCTIKAVPSGEVVLTTLDGKRTFAGKVASDEIFPFCWIDAAGLDLPPLAHVPPGSATKPQDVFIVLNQNAENKLQPAKIEASGALLLPVEYLPNQDNLVGLGPVFSLDGTCLGFSLSYKLDQPITICKLERRSPANSTALPPPGIRESPPAGERKRAMASIAIQYPYVYGMEGTWFDDTNELSVFQLPADLPQVAIPKVVARLGRPGVKQEQELLLNQRESVLEIVERHRVPNAGAGNGLAIYGSFLYCPRKSAIEVYSIEDPSKPTRLRTVGTPGTGYASDILIHKNFLYLFGFAKKELLVYDLAQPQAPKLVETLALDWKPWTGGIVRNHLYVSIHNDGAAGFQGLLVLDVSNPAKPKRIATVGTSQLPYKCLPAAQNRLVVLTGQQVQIYDTEDPSKPKLIGNPGDVYRAFCRTGYFATTDRSYVITSDNVAELKGDSLTSLGGFPSGGNAAGFPHHACMQNDIVILPSDRGGVVVKLPTMLNRNGEADSPDAVDSAPRPAPSGSEPARSDKSSSSGPRAGSSPPPKTPPSTKRPTGTELKRLEADVRNAARLSKSTTTAAAIRSRLVALINSQPESPDAIQAASLMRQVTCPADGLQRNKIAASEVAAARGRDQVQVPAALVAVFGTSAQIARINSVEFSPDGRVLATGSQDGTVRVWDLASGGQQWSVSHGPSARWITYSPDGKLLLSGGGTVVKVWDAATGNEVRQFQSQKGEIQSLAFSPDGKLLAASDTERGVHLFDATTGQLQTRLEGQIDGLGQVAISLDGSMVAAGTFNHIMECWDTRSGKERSTTPSNAGWIHSVAFSPDGQVIAGASDDHQVRIWDRASLNQLKSLGQSNNVDCVAFSRDGKTLAATASPDGKGTLTIWDWPSCQTRMTLSLGVPLFQFAMSLEGRYIAATSENGAVYVFRLAEVIPP